MRKKIQNMKENYWRTLQVLSSAEGQCLGEGLPNEEEIEAAFDVIRNAFEKVNAYLWENEEVAS